MGKFHPNLLNKLLVLVVYILLSIPALTGCSNLPSWIPGSTREKDPNVQIAKYAEFCYQRGIKYLYQSRYELAREQFSLSASAASSPELKEAALERVKLTEKMIVEKR